VQNDGGSGIDAGGCNWNGVYFVFGFYGFVERFNEYLF